MNERLRIGSIVIRCYEFERTYDFWRQAPRYEPRELRFQRRMRMVVSICHSSLIADVDPPPDLSTN